MVTGRVCTNMLSFFAKGVPETLEVKLRLVPVPVAAQDEYNENMQRYRQQNQPVQSVQSSLSGSEQIWSGLVNPASRPLSMGNTQQAQAPASMSTQLSQQISAPSPSYQAPSPAAMSVNTQRHRSGSFCGENAPSPASLAPSRTSTPTLQQQTSQTSHNGFGASRSRPASRRESIDMQNIAAPVPIRPISNDPDENEPLSEDGPPRKRAKIAKADWNGKNSFGTSTASLRVAASEAASIRLVRPLGGVSLHNGTQDMPRPPTPRVPTTNNRPLRPTSSMQLSKRRDSIQPGSNINSLVPPTPTDVADDNFATSPNDCWSQPPIDSPIDIASSPPQLPTDAMSPTQIPPSSPALPVLRPKPPMREMSDILRSDDFGQVADDDEFSLNKRSKKKKKGPGARTLTDGFVVQELPGPAENLPTKILPRSKDSQRKRIAKVHSIDPHPASDPVRPLKIIQPRLNGDEQLQNIPQIPRSESNLSTFSVPDKRKSASAEDPPSGRLDKSKRKRNSSARLHDAIEKGEMPPYCQNCGAIETPTWRRSFIKYIDDGSNGATDQSAAPGEYPPQPQAIVKKNLDEGDDGFKPALLCNPCGLWSAKNPGLRPQSFWDKPAKNNAPTRPRSTRNRSKNDGDNIESEANLESEPSLPGTDNELSPASVNSPDEDLAAAIEAATTAPRSAAKISPRPLQNNNQVSHSEPPAPIVDDDSLEKALRRAIQSSPAGFRGGSQNSPINVDTLGPTRRLLFPSPRKPGVLKSLDPIEEKLAEERIASQQNSPSPSGNDNAPENALQGHQDENSENKVPDKENFPPNGLHRDEEISRLFESQIDPALLATPSMNTAKNDAIFKTPVRPTLTFDHIAHMTPGQWHFDSLPSASKTGEAMSLPKGFTPFRGNGRTSSAGEGNDFGDDQDQQNANEQSPFSKEFTRLMSEAHYASELSDLHDLQSDAIDPNLFAVFTNANTEGLYVDMELDNLHDESAIDHPSVSAADTGMSIYMEAPSTNQGHNFKGLGLQHGIMPSSPPMMSSHGMLNKVLAEAISSNVADVDTEFFTVFEDPPELVQEDSRSGSDELAPGHTGITEDKDRTRQDSNESSSSPGPKTDAIEAEVGTYSLGDTSGDGDGDGSDGSKAMTQSSVTEASLVIV
jgi:hypothetical protein